MNLKILAFPVLIFTIIVFSIWFVYPVYSDLLITRAKLNEINGKLENIDQKTQMAEKLNGEISSKAEYQNILDGFLPAERNEEQIINEVNDIIFGGGMVFYSLAFKEKETHLEDVPVPSLDERGNPITDPVTGQPVYNEVIPKIKNAQITIGGIGDYDKIRGFLRKISSLERMNSVSSIRIFKATENSSGTEADNASSGTLKMEATVDFKYLDKVKNTIDMDDGIFTTGQLNLSALDQVKETRNTVVPELRTETEGKQNPFVL